MSYQIASIDYTALAQAMLDRAKAHLRVDFNDDDDTILQYLAWAMGLVEQATGQQIGAAQVEWEPDGHFDGFNTVYATSYPFPLQPVAVFTVFDADGNVATPYFAMQNQGLTLPTILKHKDGTPFPAGTAVTFTAGNVDPTKIFPNIEAGIYRVMAMLYENRESITALNVEEMPLWLNDLLVGTWIPRA